MIRIADLREATNAELTARWMVDLSEVLRTSDIAEIAATSGEDPAVALVASVLISDHAWVVLEHEEPICVFGCAPDPEDPNKGVVWMLGADRMDDPVVSRFILRRSRAYQRVMHRKYPVLWNYIDARNEKSLRWLEWCGFQITEAHPHHGIEARLFYTFQRHRHV